VLVTLRFAYLAVLRVFGWLALPARSDRAKDAEIRAIRSRRSSARKVPRLSWAGRAVLSELARLLPGSQLGRLRLIVSPRTVLRWHAGLARGTGLTRAGPRDGRGLTGGCGRWYW
jgi:putative transposase